MKVKSYIIAGKLLHLITLIEIAAITIILPILLDIQPNGNLIVAGLKIYLIVFLLSLPVFSQLDARSRFQNYKQIKDQIYLYGFDNRILKPVLKSRCQRDAAWLSAKELGYGKRCMTYFKLKGYRWFHLFPDFVFCKPQFIFTLYFWKTTFFSPYYKSKFIFTGNKDIDPGKFMNKSVAHAS